MANECDRRRELLSVTPGENVAPDQPINRRVTVVTDCSNCTVGRQKTGFDVTAPYQRAKRMGEQVLQVEKNTLCPFAGQPGRLNPNKLPR